MKTTTSQNESPDENKESFNQGVFATAVFLVFCCVLLAINACTLLLIWKWFVTPLVVREINFPMACGLMLVSNFFLKGVLSQQIVKVKKKQAAEVLAYNLVGTVAILLFGWVLHFFV